jgi:hypothetical protein
MEVGAMYKAISIGCLAGALLAILACERKFQGKQGSGRDLWIGISTNLFVATKCDIDFPSQNLSQKKHDQLRWYSADQNTYQIVFEPSPPNPSPGTPFEDHQHQPIFTFNVPTTAAGVKSGEPILGALGKYFAYGIKDNNGNVCKDASSADPGVNIKP